MNNFGRYWFDIDLVTDSFRVSGRVNVTTSGLLAELNSTSSDYLKLEDTYISRLFDSGNILAHYPIATFRKENISFVAIHEQRQGILMETAHSRSVYARGKELDALITVPAFEIEGTVMTDGRVAPENILVLTVGSFQPVFNAQAIASQDPELQFRGEIMLVNKGRVGAFCVSNRQVAGAEAPG